MSEHVAALEERMRQLREEQRHVDEMYEKALIEFREAAVVEVANKLRAVLQQLGVTDLGALRDHELADLLGRVGDALDVPAELRAGVFADAVASWQTSSV